MPPSLKLLTRSVELVIMGQALASDTQKLHHTATRIVAEKGSCEIAAQRGFLRLSPHNGGVWIDALSESRRPLFSLSVNGSGYAFATNVNVKDLEAQFGPADEVVRKIGRTIERAAKQGTVVTQDGFSGAKLPVAQREPTALPPEGTLAWERFTLATKLDTILSDSNGNRLDYRLFASGDRAFDIRRDSRGAGEFHIEVNRLSGLNDHLAGTSVTISKETAAYFLPDGGTPTGDERTAIDELRRWLTELKLL